MLKKMKMKVILILTIEDNSFQIISLNASFSLQREFFTYMCHENISSQLLQFVALMLKNDNSIDAEKT